jgi:hypothetical protein
LKILFLLTLLTLVSCKPETAIKSKGFSYESSGISTAAPTTGKVYLTSPIVGAQNYNFYPNITLLVSNIVAGETINLYSDSKCLKLITRIKSVSSSVEFNLGPISVENHKYYTNSSNINGTSSCSVQFATYNFQGIAPKIAQSISLISPLSSPGDISTPTFRLTGLETSEIVSLYTSSTCSLASRVATALVINSTMDLLSTPLAPGPYNFYTDSATSTGNSTCSTIYASYEYNGVLPTTPPTAMKLNYPSASPNYIDQPKILVSGGIVNGDTVKIYSDATCTTLLGSAYSTSNNVEVTLNKLTTIQNYDLYARDTNIKGAGPCSTKLLSYNYLGPVPTVAVSWNASKETIVNRDKGGYRVYYSELPVTDANRNKAKVKEVKFNGVSTPTTVDITDLAVGTYYFRVYAFGKLDTQTTESESPASDQFSITLP